MMAVEVFPVRPEVEIGETFENWMILEKESWLPPALWPGRHCGLTL